MAYLYKAIIFKSTQNVVGLDVPQNDANKTDFETNYANDCIPVSNVIIAGTTYDIDKTYADFKALITTPLTWTDVKCVELNTSYILNLLTETPL